MKSQDTVLEKAKHADRESKEIEFKTEFDPSRASHWCELIKDIVAMANSGGGCILVGVEDDGKPSDFDSGPLLRLDPATITDIVAKYTGEQYGGCRVTELDRQGNTVVAILVGGTNIPMPFTRPGTYDVGGGRQKSAFAKGTLYFRHGAKSEPGNSADIRRCIEKELDRVRKSWLGNIGRIMTADPGVELRVVPVASAPSTTLERKSIKVVDDLSSPIYRRVYADATHPHRQKEVLQLVNSRLAGKKEINSHDLLCVRRVYKVDDSKPRYYYKPRFGSPQYSDAFVDWLVKQYQEDSSFFDRAREEFKAQRLAQDQA